MSAVIKDLILYWISSEASLNFRIYTYILIKGTITLHWSATFNETIKQLQNCSGYMS